MGGEIAPLVHVHAATTSRSPREFCSNPFGWTFIKWSIGRLGRLSTIACHDPHADDHKVAEADLGVICLKSGDGGELFDCLFTGCKAMGQ
jgi:hypothetical protein